MSRLAVILKGYPRLSETFIAQEIEALEAHGLALDIISLRHPTDPAVHPVHKRIKAPVTYLPEYLHHEPIRVLTAFAFCLVHRRLFTCLWAWAKDLIRDPSLNRIRRFGQALVLAREVSSGTRLLYAHFLHTPTSVARYCALLTGLRFACSAHAKDIWTSPAWELAEKLHECAFTATCTAVNVEYLQTLAPDTHRIRLIYHGLDFARFVSTSRDYYGNDGSEPEKPLRILSVGRAVEKKGYDDLLHALALLPKGLHWRMLHIGGGEKRQALIALGKELGLDGRIDWAGPKPQDEVLRAYRQHTIFVLASRIASDGDRDGLPNVLMEAQSQGLACLATNVSAIPELIIHGRTGELAPPSDPRGLSAGLQRLMSDPARRDKLARAGERRVRAMFSMQSGIDELLGLFASQGLRARE